MNGTVEVPLNLPAYPVKTRVSGGALQVFDPARRKYVQLTREEWVRQHFINYLVAYCGVPLGLVGVEVALRLNSVSHRADVVVYGRAGNPIALVECKAPEVELSASVIEQAGRYNVHFRAKYLLLTNGLKHYSVAVDWESGRFMPMQAIPSYMEMIT